MATRAEAVTAPTPAPFGTAFAEHMAVSWYRDGRWSKPTMCPSDSLPLHPAAHVLHYGSSCFEGLKAYRWADDTVHLFRLDRHIERMRRSAELLCLPVPDPMQLTAMICGIVDLAHDEIPPAPGALYVRPTLIGTQANIGAAATATTEACLFVLVSPVGDYFAGGGRPLRILVDDEGMRSTPEFGMAKTGANYVQGLRHILKAKAEHGADQVLFCPGGDVQETGASNFLLIDDASVLTKPLDASYLHGVTRDSVLAIARRLGYETIERDIRVPELLERAKGGEAALSGTAAVLAAVGSLVYRRQEHMVGDGGIGTNTKRLRDALVAVQRGEAPDELGWLTEV